METDAKTNKRPFQGRFIIGVGKIWGILSPDLKLHFKVTIKIFKNTQSSRFGKQMVALAPSNLVGTLWN